MTIQEKAIEQLERISEHLSAIGEKEDYTNIAIQALEQQQSDEDFIHHKKEVLERIAKREAEIDKYIKELEKYKQQPCEDCISRKAVLDLVADYDLSMGQVVKGIHALPSVKPTNEDISEAYIKGYDYGVKDWFKSKTQPCEDCVSRADVKEQMLKYGFNAPDMTVTEFVEDCLQPVTPQPKMGRWIADVDRWGDIVTTVNGYRCSECNTFDTDKDNYCPNCGAKMEVEE